MRFSETAWCNVGPWFDAIMAHPFVVSLSKGTLPEGVFVRYLLDDAHYLIGYARVLTTLASRATAPEASAMLACAAAETLEAERLLHRSFLIPRGIDPDTFGVAEPSPTCRAYIGTLLQDAVFAPLEIGMASVLPCFRVYAEVGRAMLATQPAPGHPYRQWIQTYADPGFDRIVQAAESYTDTLAHDAPPPRIAAMLVAYERATRLEWMFWEAAWQDERWPHPASVGVEAP